MLEEGQAEPPAEAEAASHEDDEYEVRTGTTGLEHIEGIMCLGRSHTRLCPHVLWVDVERVSCVWGGQPIEGGFCRCVDNRRTMTMRAWNLTHICSSKSCRRCSHASRSGGRASCPDRYVRMPLMDCVWACFCFMRAVRPAVQLLALERPFNKPCRQECGQNGPSLQTRRSARKTLVLDLDETLVHSTLDGFVDPDFTFPVFFNNKECAPLLAC